MKEVVGEMGIGSCSSYVLIARRRGIETVRLSPAFPFGWISDLFGRFKFNPHAHPVTALISLASSSHLLHTTMAVSAADVRSALSLPGSSAPGPSSQKKQTTAASKP